MSVMKCFAAGVCFVAALTVCLALYIYADMRTLAKSTGERVHEGVSFFFLKAGVFEMNLTYVVKVTTCPTRTSQHVT